jgi:AraC-like DNA-binding protein
MATLHELASKRFRVMHSLADRGRLSPYAAALSVVQINSAADGGAHIGMPVDLYTLTVHCDQQLACRSDGPGAGLRVVLSALRTRPTLFSTHGSGQLAVAQLTPWGVLKAFGFPLRGLTDQRLLLRDIDSARSECALQARLLDARSGAERSAALAHWLEQRMAEPRRLARSAQRVAAVAMDMLNNADVDIDAHASRHGLSRRQLERDFRLWLGPSPSAYARLVRFQRAASALANGMPPAHVAADHGFSDQAHMTRSFRDTAELTPGEVRAAGTAGQGVALRSAMGGRVVMHPAQLRPAAAAQPGLAWAA